MYLHTACVFEGNFKPNFGIIIDTCLLIIIHHSAWSFWKVLLFLSDFEKLLPNSIALFGRIMSLLYFNLNHSCNSNYTTVFVKLWLNYSFGETPVVINDGLYCASFQHSYLDSSNDGFGDHATAWFQLFKLLMYLAAKLLVNSPLVLKLSEFMHGECFLFSTIHVELLSSASRLPD